MSKAEHKMGRVQHLPTVEAQFKLVAERILSRFATNINDHYRDALALIASGERVCTSSWLSVDVNLGKYGIKVSVEYDPWRGADRDWIQDADTKNFYAIVPGKVEVSWPSWGSMDAGDAVAILKFFSEVADFAKSLEVELRQATIRLMQTAEQYAEENEKRRQRETQAVIDRNVDAVRKNMRMGSERPAKFEGVPAGKYSAEFADGKRYTVYVIDGGSGNVVRTA